VVVVITLDIEIWEIGKGGTIRGMDGKRGGWMGEMVWDLLGFVALVCIWVCFCCCSGGCVCQGFQRASQQVVSVLEGGVVWCQVEGG
jgi:hypothetical protein